MEIKEELENYFSQESPFKADLQRLRSIIKNTQLKEEFKWNAPIYTLDQELVLGLGKFKNHYGVWFFNGALLEDTRDLLYNTQEGETKTLRQLRYMSGDEIDEILLKSYIDEAIVNQKEQKKMMPEKNGAVMLPAELENALTLSAHLKSCFYKLTLEEQNDYAQHIVSGKDEPARLLRVEHCLPTISSGMPLSDKKN